MKNASKIKLGLAFTGRDGRDASGVGKESADGEFPAGRHRFLTGNRCPAGLLGGAEGNIWGGQGRIWESRG